MKKHSFLDIENLNVKFKTRDGIVHVLKDVSLQLEKGEILGVVGESGSGKSVTAYSVLDLNGKASEITAGSIVFDGMNLHQPTDSLMSDIRGSEISMIFQNPMSTLNPIRSVRQHLEDMLLAHNQAVQNLVRTFCLKT